MRCQYCGRSLNENAKFCSGCGKPVRIQTQSQVQVGPGQRVQVQVQQQQKQMVQNQLDRVPAIANMVHPSGNGQHKPSTSNAQSYWEPSKVRWFIVLMTTGAVAALSLLAMLVLSDAIHKITALTVDASVAAANELSTMRFAMFGALVLLGLTLALSIAGFRDGSKHSHNSL